MLALPLGLGRASAHAALRLPCAAYIEFFRGTSLIVQLFWLYFVLPPLGVRLEAMTAAILGITLNYGAYGAEIVRGALGSVPQGQVQAARALGLSPWQVLRHVVAPQAMTIFVRPWGNLMIQLLKATSLVSLITIADLTFRAYQKLPYEPIRDFTPVARVSYFPFVLAVNAALPVKTVAELIAYAKDNKAKVSYGFGNSTGQVAGAAFTALTKIDATAIPYKSTPQALTDLAGGQIAFLFVDLASSAPHVKSGRLRMLAVTTEKASALAPSLPTVAAAAQLPGFDLAAWVGVLAPAGMPADVTGKLSAAINKMLSRPEVAERFAGMGSEAAPGDAAELDRTMRTQLQAWGNKVREAGIAPE